MDNVTDLTSATLETMSQKVFETVYRGRQSGLHHAAYMRMCKVTLQMVMYPEKLLSEMVRVASRQIVCFPNFANLRNRVELLLMGRMPRAMLFGYSWWDTGHIHQLSVRDFEEYLPRVGLRIRRRAFFGRLATAASFAPNLFATLAAFELESAVVSSK
jgi:methionine biosynthesis protein MetW